ncbi:carboxylating nicotinate-nucleotide diphosphorylase [Candidatus Omnitrophota bacterium]
MDLDKERVMSIIKAALKEDIGKGDITTSSVIKKYSSSSAAIVTREDCVACGLLVAEWLIGALDYSVRFKPMCKDGAFVGAGGEFAMLDGNTASILRAERTMLNFLSLLSGIAAKTSKFVEIAKPFGVRIMDTRKTFPLLRYLEKYAVSVGGGHNHRMGLYDQVLIKDNHIKVTCKQLPVSGIIESARKKNPKGTVVEIEAGSIEEFREALSAGPDIIMLDNMRIADIKACVELRRKSERAKPMLEASGGVNLENVKDYARTGVEMISIGGLTSAVKSIDLSLEIV